MRHKLSAQSTPWQAEPVDICFGLLMDSSSSVLAVDPVVEDEGRSPGLSFLRWGARSGLWLRTAQRGARSGGACVVARDVPNARPLSVCEPAAIGSGPGGLVEKAGEAAHDSLGA